MSQLDNRQHTDAILDESFRLVKFVITKSFNYIHMYVTYMCLVYYSAELVSLILNMTKNSESYLNQLVDVKAFNLIGYLLEKVNKVLV